MSALFLNEGGHFREAGQATGVGFAPKSGMNVAYGDILNQGKYAIYVSNISEEGVLIQGNNLWGPGKESQASSMKTWRGIWGWNWEAGVSALSLAI